MLQRFAENDAPDRRSTLSDRDSAVIMGACPNKSAYTLWAEKTGLIAPAPPGQLSRLSRDMEILIASRFTQETGLKTRRAGFVMINSAYPYAHAKVGRLVLGQEAGLTCRAVSSLSLRRFSGTEFPLEDYYRCLHQMMVTGKKAWYLAVEILGKDFRIFRLERDENVIKALALGLSQFWQRIQQKNPPTMDGSVSTVRTIEALYPQGLEKDLDLEPIGSYVTDYLRWKQREQEAHDAAQTRANTIKAFMGSAQRGHYGNIQVLWHTVTQTIPDTAALFSAHPELDPQAYRCTVTSRRFQVLPEENAN